ncbi:hypothetical protein KCU81_g1861, partial [Aureobasidium melanogenum]|uniref:Uncharacterized protein n=1 Tax=Aureobasidium melanogenum (strain CBS 110374) TaxID=1043003 RepID=A0A074VTK6_AURM1
MESARNKMQKVLQFASEHRQRIFRISYIALVLPILILTVIPLLSPIFLHLPNADVVEFQLYRSSATIDIGYHSIWLGHSELKSQDPYVYVYREGYISTIGRHLDGKTLAQRWGEVAGAGPEVYQQLVKEFDMALNLQRNAFYPGLLIAAGVFWALGVGLLGTTSLFRRRQKSWALRAYKGFAVIGSLFILVATICTTASVNAVVEYIGPYNMSGRLGAILAVQWAAAGAMAVHALLAFAVAGDVQDQSEGAIRLDD